MSVSAEEDPGLNSHFLLCLSSCPAPPASQGWCHQTLHCMLEVEKHMINFH